MPQVACKFDCGRKAIKGRDICISCTRLPNADLGKQVLGKVGQVAAIPADEPIFILRAQDKLAPEIVREWITRAAACGVAIEKLHSAQQCADDIEAWQVENPTKVPD